MRDPQNDQLLSRLQSGDERALAELADAYGTKIFQLAFRYLRNKEDAEEVTQDVLFKVYRKVGEFRGDAALPDLSHHVQRRNVAVRTAGQQAREDDRQDLPDV